MDNTVAAQYHTLSSRLEWMDYLFDIRFLVSTNQINQQKKTAGRNQFYRL